MRNKALLFSLFLLVSSPVPAESGLLKEVAKQAVKDTATAAAPDAVEKAAAASKILENVKNLKDSVENAPDSLKVQMKETVKDAVKQKLERATPAETQKAVELLKSGQEKLEAAPKSPETIKSKVKQKAAEKALKLLR
jgi:hypothetical protein